MKTVIPGALRRRYGFESAEFEFLIRRARECLLWKMSPDYYDSMTQIEYVAWVAAWNELQQEQKG